ncbi:sel1 repeat family protein [Salinicola endophyticus]|uniref:Sel1 repeat family protein n=1 Tax=Salinicola endophyticus TaxID=1949083 RepID=A0ABY8FL85_9GAMM|nr:tetratricopeptide repeat protein [Salinicola endophyticus]WFF43372.1 sel1 repeat family protein [Salinicola endophyticus]
MKNLFVFVFIALSVFARSAHAEVFFQDPTGRSLNEAYDDLTIESLKSADGANEYKYKYMLGLLYVKGDDEFGVAKNCDKAVGLLKEAWQADVVDAGYTLATMYYYGVCVNKNLDEVRQLATETAEEGYILSQRMLGRAYWGRDWQGLYSKNMNKAVFWLSKAGEAGDTQSAGNLSYLYRKGVGVGVDEAKSFYWAKKSACSKFEPGQIINFPYLAEYYDKGIGVDRDLVKAYKYYDLSGSAGVDDKKRIAKEMTQEQIDEALRQSKEWQKEHNVQVGGGFIRRAN